jgi:uncharacterized protein (DUF1501 family)
MSHSRRRFLHHSACAAVGAGAARGLLAGLRRVGAVTQAGDDYKALVCVFLFGGNDGDNTLIPRGNAEYGSYAAARGVLAVPQGRLLSLTPLTSDGRQYGLHPSLPELQELFAQRRLAVVANVGTLVAPLTKADYLSGRAPTPPHLFAHNEQQAHWMTSWADGQPQTGWGGRLADLLNALNTNAQLSMAVSVAGSNLFQVGQTVTPYHPKASQASTPIGPAPILTRCRSPSANCWV